MPDDEAELQELVSSLTQSIQNLNAEQTSTLLSQEIKRFTRQKVREEASRLKTVLNKGYSYLFLIACVPLVGIIWILLSVQGGLTFTAGEVSGDLRFKPREIPEKVVLGVGGSGMLLAFGKKEQLVTLLGRWLLSGATLGSLASSQVVSKEASEPSEKIQG